MKKRINNKRFGQADFLVGVQVCQEEIKMLTINGGRSGEMTRREGFTAEGRDAGTADNRRSLNRVVIRLPRLFLSGRDSDDTHR